MIAALPLVIVFSLALIWLLDRWFRTLLIDGCLDHVGRLICLHIGGKRAMINVSTKAFLMELFLGSAIYSDCWAFGSNMMADLPVSMHVIQEMYIDSF